MELSSATIKYFNKNTVYGVEPNQLSEYILDPCVINKMCL